VIIESNRIVERIRPDLYALALDYQRRRFQGLRPAAVHPG
jgi:hypothetical protein